MEMNRRVSKLVWLVVLLVVISATNVNAQEEETDADSEQIAAVNDNDEGFNRWDADQDDLLDKNEFAEAMEQKFDEWANNNGLISRGEWKKNISLQYGFREYEGAYSEWDTDGSKGLDKGEFVSGLMSIFDENSDGNIDGREYRFWTREPDSR